MVDPASLGIVMLLVVGMGCLLGLAVGIWLLWLLSSWLGKIPPEHRKQEPGMVWLLLIPLFNLVWNFFVFPRIADSFDSYFKSRGESVDAGRSMATTFCILSACSLATMWIPLIGFANDVAILVLFVLLMVKFKGLKDRIAPG